MKRYSIYLLLAIAIVTGCKKSQFDLDISGPPQMQTTAIKVIEKFTNKPVAGATVYLKKCSRPDFEFGCLEYTTHSILTTNNLGQVTYSGYSSVDAVEVKHDNYWVYYSKRTYDVILTPKTIIEVRIKRVKAYAPNDVLYIGQHQFGQYGFNFEPIGLPLDTVVFIKGAGYTINQISWYINYLSTDTLHTTPSFYINGFDSAKVDIEY